MALVTRLSTPISNYDAQPRVLTSGYLVGANDTVAVGTVQTVATDSIGSIYKYLFLPSGVRIEDIQIQNEASTAGVWSLGVYTNDLQSLNLQGVSGPSPGSIYSQWNVATTYVTGQVVIYQGVVYTASAGSTGSTPPSGNWTTGLAAVIPPATLVIASAVGILGTGISTAAASTTWKSVYSPTVTTSAYAASNVNLRIWELLGMAQDPYYEFVMALTATTAPTAVANISLQLTWVR
jgi:hypothetical protein